MKNIFIFIIFMLLIFMLLDCKTTEKVADLYSMHYGKWVGEIKGKNTISLYLKKSGKAEFLINEKKIKLDEITGKNYKTIYAIDYAKNPYELDIVFITNKKNGVNRVIRCIFGYMTDSVIKISTYFSPIRPLEFDEKDTFYIKKEAKIF